MVPAKFLLDKKREGRALGSLEIREFIEGFTKGEIPDYQMSAMAMAICCRGMTERETADLTDAMMRSGICLDWGGVSAPTADKHSTGGVGDKLSLVIQPLAAACGVAVPSLAGRGLGITGGTADKLEAIPGYRCSVTMERFKEIVAEAGVSIAVQTDEICPADKKLYALRDVTGTVASIPLITASILSKKLAEGAGALVFDVKAGAGAFMKTPEEARELARSLVSGARAAGRKAAVLSQAEHDKNASAVLVTDMNAPLGRAVGNANEVAEALRILGGEEGGAVADLSVELAAMMVSLAREIPLEEARELAAGRLADGSALARFEAMVTAHGGDLSRFRKLLEKPTFKFKIQAMKSGYVAAIDAEKVGRVALQLGAGRERTGDRIDPLAGINLEVAVGDRVSVGAPLATLEKSFDPDGLEKAAGELFKAFLIAPAAPEARGLVIERVEEV